MRKVTLERQRERRRGRLTTLAVLLGSLLVLLGSAGTVLGSLPMPMWGVIAAGELVAAWLVSRLHRPHSERLRALGLAHPQSAGSAFVLLGLQLGILVGLALALLGWVLLAKGGG
ncbi:MAG: hypothetical protein KKA73_09140 [Chloroflexi bacterium]|nr:hypothetical protein [Chloroflexota bacterium]